MKTARQILQDARALLAAPERHNDALVSVLLAASQGCSAEAGSDAYIHLQRTIGLQEWQLLYDWQNAPGSTHADVLAALDRAIASLPEENL